VAWANENAPPDPADRTGVDESRRGVWRYRPRLPITEPAHIVSLGEGATPVVDVPRWGAMVGAPRTMVKLEQIAPTGSFKDRGMTLVVSRAVEVGAQRLIEDSSGNAGASTAAYAARAGIPATVYVPAAAPVGKIRQIAAGGARVVPVDGPRERVTEVAIEACRDASTYYVGHNVNPYFSFGMTTFAYELIEQFGDRLPHHVVMPAGGGSIYVGCWRGLRIALGPEARLPRLHLVQPEGCPPIVVAQRSGSDCAVAIARRPTIAGGAEIEHPSRDREMLAALRDTNGVAVAVSDDAIRAARRALARAEGMDVEPTAALAPAGLEALVRQGVIGRGDSVLMVTTGAGLKVPED
jgi:threonine synthase